MNLGSLPLPFPKGPFLERRAVALHEVAGLQGANLGSWSFDFLQFPSSYWYENMMYFSK